MPSLDVALASFWQLARHWPQGEAAKLKMSCEAESLNIQLNANLRHSDLLHFHYPYSPPLKGSNVLQFGPLLSVMVKFCPK